MNKTTSMSFDQTALDLTVCCLCGGDIEMDQTGTYRRSNNPWPVATGDHDVCCDACDDFVVIPARVRRFNARQ